MSGDESQQEVEVHEEPKKEPEIKHSISAILGGSETRKSEDNDKPSGSVTPKSDCDDQSKPAEVWSVASLKYLQPAFNPLVLASRMAAGKPAFWYPWYGPTAMSAASSLTTPTLPYSQPHSQGMFIIHYFNKTTIFKSCF